MALGAAGGASGTRFFSQIICLMFYCHEIVTVIVNMTKSYFYTTFCFKAMILFERTDPADFYHVGFEATFA